MTDEMLRNESQESPVRAPETPRRGTSALRGFFAGVGVVAALALFGAGFLGYRAVHELSLDPLAVRFADLFHIAVARVNGTPLLYRDYASDVDSLTTFYAGIPSSVGPTPSREQISDQVLMRLAANAIVSDLAKKYGVAVRASDVDSSDLLKKLLKQFPTNADAEKELRLKYHLTLAEYKQKVVLPVLLEQKLQEAFAVSTDAGGKPYEEPQVRARHILFAVSNPKNDAAAKAKATNILKKILGGADFASLALQYGSDSTKTNGGDLGWFGRGQMVKPFEDAAFGTPSGAVHPTLVKSQFGYHIIKVDSTRTARNYSAFMNDQLKRATIEILLSVHNPFIALREQLNALSASSTPTP